MHIFGVYFNKLSVVIFIGEVIIFSILFWLAFHRVLMDSGINESVLIAQAFGAGVILALALSAIGAYRHDARRVSRLTVNRFLLGAALAFVVLIVAATILPDGSLPRGFAWSWLLGVLGAALLAAATARLLGQHLNFLITSLKPRVLVIGTGSQAEAVAQACRERRGARLIGFAALSEGDLARATVDREAIIDVGDRFMELARARQADEIVVAFEDRRGRLPVDRLLQCRMQGIDVIDAASFLERETGRIDIDVVRPSWLIFSNGFTMPVGYDIAKRIADVIFSALGLVAAFPLLLLVALAIRLETPGGAFYTQQRVGRFGELFTIIKFRSMYIDAEQRGCAQWATKNDPRVTRVGRIIRRTRLDELPQLLNVLRGDMSFIGPRPERPQFVAELAAEIPYYNERHRIRPGLTGWAQINYRYSDSIDSSKEKLCYDLYYMKKRNLFLDMVIVQQTLRILVSGEGAH